MQIKNKIQIAKYKSILPVFGALLLGSCFLFLVSSFGCKIYSFREKVSTIGDTIKTIKIIPLDNNARYINPQLSPQLTDKLRQKITSQTKLTQTNGDNPDWEINGAITDYSFSTSGISDQRVASNKLTVAIHITIIKHKQDGKTEDYDITRSFEFKGDLSFQQAEQQLGTEMIRTLADEIFNKLFSNW